MPNCTRHFLNFEWEHHRWRRRVTAADNLPALETDMWGRSVHGTAVRCHKEYVCEVCGTTRGGVSCHCDPAYADHCAIRLAWIERHPDAGAPSSSLTP